MTDPSPLHAAQTRRALPSFRGREDEDEITESPRRAVTLPVEPGIERTFSTATTFEPSLPRAATGLTRYRTFDSNPNGSISDLSFDLESKGEGRRLSSSGSSTEGAVRNRGRLRSLLSGRSSKRYPLENACFSAAGTTLYLWKPRERKVAILSVLKPQKLPSIPAPEQSCGSAEFVTGGNRKYVVVSAENAPDARIELYSNPAINDSGEPRPPHGGRDGGTSAAPQSASFKLRSASDSFAISRDDGHFGWASPDSVRIWDLQTWRSRDIPVHITRDSPVDSQRMAFSADCEKVVLATRFVDGHVAIKSWTLSGQAVESATMETEHGITHDYGLTSVFCDNARKVAVVTMMVSGVARMLRSFKGSSDFSWPSAHLQQPRFSYKVVCAAQSETGNRIAFATSNNRIYSFSLERSSIKVSEVADFSSERPSWLHLRHSTALACPTERITYAFFWPNGPGAKMTFAILEDGKKPECSDIGSCFSSSDAEPA